ncbi:hypothetical protein BH23CHL2_BH23CHL2_07370 [soil metagenome]
MSNLPKPDLADEAKAQKERVASTVNGAADQVARQGERAVEGTRSVADKIRERAGSVPGSEKAGDVASSAAGQLKKGADYLRDSDVSSRAVSVVKNNPVKTALAALVAAVLIGLKIRSKPDESTPE